MKKLGLIGAIIGFFVVAQLCYAQNTQEVKEDLNTVGEDAQMKQDVFDPGSWGVQSNPTDQLHKLDGKGDNGISDPGGWGVQEGDITEQDNWDYQNNPNRINEGKEDVFDPGGWGVKGNNISGSGQSEQPPMETIKSPVFKNNRMNLKNQRKLKGNKPDSYNNKTSKQQNNSYKKKYKLGTPKSGTGNVGNPPSNPSSSGGNSSGPKRGKGGKKTNNPKPTKKK